MLQAGTSHRDKYVAAPLNVTGHAVEAVLVIKNPAEQDAGFEYFLEASNEIGTQKYLLYKVTLLMKIPNKMTHLLYLS